MGPPSPSRESVAPGPGSRGKPAVEEARQAALEDLVPAAIKSLQAHLGDGDPNACRAALRVFEHAFGRAPEQVVDGVTFSETSEDVRRLSWVQLQTLAAQLVDGQPAVETMATAGTAASSTARTSSEMQPNRPPR